MFIDPLDIPSHWVISNEVDFMSHLGEILCPALGMDTASVGDEAEDHRLITPAVLKVNDSLPEIVDNPDISVISFIGTEFPLST